MKKKINPVMRISSLLSAGVVLSHMAIMVWYYSHPQGWQSINPAEAGFWFFGVGFILMSINMLISSSITQTPIQLEITKLHGVFVLTLGSIYALHYSGILISNNNEKYYMVLSAVLIAVVIVFINAFRHGFFKIRD